MIRDFNRIDNVMSDMSVFTAVYKDGDKTMFTAAEIAQLIKTLFYNFRVNADSEADIASMIDFIVYNYDTEIKRMYNVLTVEYNPIENYNKTSTVTDTGNANSTNYNVPVDSTAEKETSKTAVTNGNTRVETTSGNIGTMSTQNMITQEMEIRVAYNVKMFVVQRFKEFYLIA